MLMRTRVVLRPTVISEIYITLGNKISVCIVTPFTGLIIRTSTSIPSTQLCVGRVYIRHRISMLVARQRPIGPESTRAGTFACQPERIDPAYRVWRVSIGVEATGQPNRILADEPPAARIIVPMPVIVKPGLATTSLH